MLPLKALIRVKGIVGPDQLDRFNGFLAAKVLGDSAPGVSSGQAIAVVEEVAAKVLPPGYYLAWTGQAFQEKRTGQASVIAFIFALLMVFLILSAKYERWSLPVAVLLAVPFALLGALLAILARGMSNDIYFQIGLVTLIGLAAKNAILIVEFAAQNVDAGMDVAARGHRGRAAALPAYRDDLARVHVRGCAAGAGHRRRRGGKALDGHRRVRRHARRDLRRHAVRAAVLHAARPAQGEARRWCTGVGEFHVTLRAALMLGLVLLLGACAAVGPDYRRPAVNLPGAYPDAQADVSGAAAVPAEWWKLYGDQRLDELVASALARNADMRIAVARIEETDANLREAGAAFLPEVDLDAAPQRQRLSALTATPVPSSVPLVRNDIRLTLGTSFELDFWGKLRRSARSHARARIGFALRAGSRDPVACRTDHPGVFLAMLARCADRADAHGAGEPAGDARPRARSGARRHRLGSGPEPGRRRACRCGRPAEGTAAATRAGGTPVGNADRKAGPAAGVRGPARAAAAAAAAGRAALDAAAAPARRVAGGAAVDRRERPDRRRQGGDVSDGLADLLLRRREQRAVDLAVASGARIWSMGFGLGLPIFDAGTLRRAHAGGRGARSARPSRITRRRSKPHSAKSPMRSATLQQTAASEQDLQQRADAARNALRLARLRYEAGYSAYLEVLDAQRTASDAELAFLRNRQSRLVASVDLMKALGGGWSGGAMPLANAALREGGGK